MANTYEHWSCICTFKISEETNELEAMKEHLHLT